MQRRRAAGRLGPRPTELSCRREGSGRTGRVRKGAERDRPAGALADRRRGRPRAVDQHPPDLRRRRRLQRRELRRAELPFRRARARHERRPERHVAVQDPRLWLRLPDLQRLRAAGDPAQLPDGDPDDPHLHARFHRRRRGRPDAPAGGAPRLAPGDPGADRAAPGGRQRGGRGVAGHHAASPRARGADPDAAEPADARPQPVRLGRRGRQGRLRAGRRRERQAGRAADGAPAARSRCASPPTSSSSPRASAPG